jgi:UDP-N-acetylmuramoyl-tripeptide--D-alanyl-D-alanine ligase
MHHLTLQKILEITGGQAVPTAFTAAQLAQTIRGVATDSRTLVAGECFIALPGETFDGHKFVADAAYKGASLAIVSRRLDLAPALPPIPLIQVASTQEALEKLACFCRATFSPVYVAITGSVGKTTSKEMTYDLVSAERRVIKSHKSFNNNIGVPLTLLQLHAEHQVAILELGTNHFGEIAALTRIVRPNIAVITCVAPTHLEGLGSIAGVERAKGEILLGMDAKAILITNSDDPACLRIAKRHCGKVVTFGCGASADLRAQDIEGSDSGISFVCEKSLCRVPVPGKHNVYNVLAAMGVAREIGMPWPRVVAGLTRLSLPEARMQIYKKTGITLIADCYNASPRAVMAAIDFLRESDGKRKVAVLGSMLELGEQTDALHYQVGEYLATHNIDFLWTVGKEAAAMAKGAEEHGLAKERICMLADGGKLLSELFQALRPGDVVLFKASHRLQFETLVAELLQRLGGGK